LQSIFEIQLNVFTLFFTNICAGDFFAEMPSSRG